MKVPPYCPNVECRNHFPDSLNDSAKPWFWKIGFRVSQTNPLPIQRYKCKHCGRQFSESTFSVNYYSKKVINLKKLMRCLVSGMSVRAMGRFFNCSPNTINRKLGVIARKKRINSKRQRDLRNDLFPVNYIDREIRKDLAEQSPSTSITSTAMS